MQKSVLITGASGLLGRALMREYLENSYRVLGLAHSRAKEKHYKVDLNDSDEVEKIIEEFDPDIIVHSAAQRHPDKVENNVEEARKLNVTCSKNLAAWAGKHGVAFVYISTDYVFDGQNPPYSEDAIPNPLNLYGKTKYEGEKEVLRVNPDSCILRIPVIYGGEEFIGESAVSSLVPVLKNTDHNSNVSNFEVRYPCHTSDIAYVCFRLTEEKLKNPAINSIFHWCGKEALTKYKMAEIIAEVQNLPFFHIIPENNPSSGAPRPKDTELSCERLKSLGIFIQHTPFHIGVTNFCFSSTNSKCSFLK